jgi:hypothetical protein
MFMFAMNINMFVLGMNIMEVDIELLQALQDKSLLRLLKAVERHGGSDGIGTRLLLETFNGNDLHRKLVQADREGYLTRDKEESREGKKGNYRVFNKLTPRGKRLLDVAELI